MKTRQWLGVVGSVALFIGVFMPIVSVPIVGSVNYFRNGRGEGALVLVLALVSLVLALAGKYKWLEVTGLGSLGVLSFTFVAFQLKLSEARADLRSELAGNPFAALGDVALECFQLQAGWAVLVVGAVLVTASAIMKDDG